jgi:hypothetical protein
MGRPARREVIRFRWYMAATAAVLLAFAAVFRTSDGVFGAMVLVATAYGIGLIAYLIVASLGIEPPGRRRVDR